MEGSLECLPGEDIQAVKEGFKSYLLKSGTTGCLAQGESSPN